MAVFKHSAGIQRQPHVSANLFSHVMAEPHTIAYLLHTIIVMVLIFLPFLLYFIDYAITVVLIFLLYPPPPSTPYSLRQSLHNCSRPWVMCISYLAIPFAILYVTSSWLFCNYQFVILNPLTSSPIPLHLPPIWQPSKHSPYP